MAIFSISSITKLKNDLLNERKMAGDSEARENVSADIWKKALEDIMDPTSRMSEAQEKEYHNKILKKLKQGRRLTTEEKNYLQIHDPEMYKVAVRVEISRKRFTEQAKHCKSKEEFQALLCNAASTVEKDPMKEYIQAAISYEAQNIRKTPQYAALPDTNSEADEKNKKGQKIKKLKKVQEKEENEESWKIQVFPSENYRRDLKMDAVNLSTESMFDNYKLS